MMARWLISTLLALFCWGIWAVLGKVIGDALSGAQTQALSTIGMLPVIVLLMFSKRVRSTGPKKRGSIYAFAAGLCGCAGNIAYYEILKSGEKASTVVPLTALYPLITILLAVLLLREKLNRIQLSGVLLALVAIYLFNVQQAHGIFSRWFLIVLIPICFWGVAGLLQKMSTNYISGELSTLWFLAASIPAAALLFIREPLTDSPGNKIHLLVFFIGFTFALGNWAILDAFATGGKASIITPISGLYSMVSIPIAIIFLGERIGRREMIAIAIALAAIVAISLESKPESKNEAHAG
jgi:drug/metabolite transporter (DMT)-like permease